MCAVMCLHETCNFVGVASTSFYFTVSLFLGLLTPSFQIIMQPYRLVGSSKVISIQHQKCQSTRLWPVTVYGPDTNPTLYYHVGFLHQGNSPNQLFLTPKRLKHKDDKDDSVLWWLIMKTKTQVYLQIYCQCLISCHENFVWGLL